MLEGKTFKLNCEGKMIWKKYTYLHKSNNNIYFDCQCGKRYTSFPAIFLHFKKKHHRKVSINTLSQDFEVRKLENETVYFYFLRSKCTQDDYGSFSNSSAHPLQQFFLRFLEEEKAILQPIITTSYLKKMLRKLEIFANQQNLNHQIQNIESRQLLYSLPLYFNEFIRILQLNNELLKPENLSSLCLGLLRFSQWLNKNCLSQLITQLNLK